jgi:alpha-mannosidase
MSSKKVVHLICNAHLDPVWLWEWEEGAAEAISTFRTAAELAEKNGTFIFNHNEVTLYKWVQEYEPQLFERIKKLVKKGNWHIMGGWYLQPDCNMPSGESFVRQILLGKAYFKKHFGVEPHTAINFDPFGHTQGLVQIMKKSGFTGYLFGRPTDPFIKFPADDFIWQGYDGSQILATRFSGWYNTGLGKAAPEIEKRIALRPNEDVQAILWGVGNHGGGPSRKDIADVNKLIQNRKDVEIRHSTPEEYHKGIAKNLDKLQKWNSDINPWAVGCYTSMIRVKQKHRLLENEIYCLEKMASTASANGLMKYPYEEIHEALCDLMVGEFHDILPGSSVQPVEEAAIRMFDHALEITSRLKARAFFSLASGQKKANEGEIPILVYNHHPFKVQQTVECEFNIFDFNWDKTFTNVHVYQNGKQIPCQVEQELSMMGVDWRKRVVFNTTLLPNQMNRFDCRLEVIPQKPQPKVKAKNDKFIFKTKDLEVVVNAKTGLIDKYKVNGRDFVKAGAFKPIVLTDDLDPWGMTITSFPDVCAEFKVMDKKEAAKFAGITSNKMMKGVKELDAVRVIEDGPVRTVIEALFKYDDSFICQKYRLPKYGTEIEIEMTVLWNQKQQMLKLQIPVNGKNAEYIGQVAYGVGKLPSNGGEAVAQKWTAVVSKKDNSALSCINDGIYGSDFNGNLLKLTLLRSAAYSTHPMNEEITIPKDRFMNRIDQGQRNYKFWFNAGKLGDRLEKIDRESLVKNEKPFALSFFPNGDGKTPKPLAILSDNAVQITTMKKAESNDDMIIRLFEPTGKNRTATLSLPAIGKTIKINLGKFEIKTIRINAKTGKYFETDLLEKPIK